MKMNHMENRVAYKRSVTVEVFKTNVESARAAIELQQQLHRRFPCVRFNFDLMDYDNILRAEGQLVDVAAIIQVLAVHHYDCEPLPD
jgi:hypothetical protein